MCLSDAACPPTCFYWASERDPPRDCTKIGGLPFWPHDRAWPESEDGRPLPFLAQFCFRESRDLVGDLPEEMLLLFGDKDDPANVVGRWQSPACRTRLVDCDEMPVEPIAPSFYGIRWRTENFPDAEYGNDGIVLADGTTVSEKWFVCTLMGMQIGSHPFFPRWEGRPGKTEKTVCAMSAVFPIPGFPWPFINRSSPLTEQEVEPLSLDLCEIKDADGFGVLCVVVSDSGEPELLFENL